MPIKDLAFIRDYFKLRKKSKELEQSGASITCHRPLHRLLEELFDRSLYPVARHAPRQNYFSAGCHVGGEVAGSLFGTETDFFIPNFFVDCEHICNRCIGNKIQ